MKKLSNLVYAEDSGPAPDEDREGSVLLITCFCTIILLAAAALSVDVGYMQLEKIRLQNAVDAAALAASQEITQSIRHAPIGTPDPAAYAADRAREAAVKVAALGGVYIHPFDDVDFGKRSIDPVTGNWFTTWGSNVNNTVKVRARRTESDPSLPDGRLRLFFAPVIGHKYTSISASATAFVQPRDIVVVHDFSRSMNFDSHFPLKAEASKPLNRTATEANMQKLWDDLQPTNTGSLPFKPVYFSMSSTNNGITATGTFKYDTIELSVEPNTFLDKAVITSFTNTAETSTKSTTITFNDNTSKNTASTGANISSVQLTTYRWVAGTKGKNDTRTRSGYRQEFGIHTLSDSDTNIRSAFGISNTYPFPAGSWSAYFKHTRTDEQMIEKGYREMYGGLSFVNYTLRTNSHFNSTPRLTTARHYPFTSIKEGHSLLCNFLETLSFDDRLGMTSYDTKHRIESFQSQPKYPWIPNVDIRSEPITNNYKALDNLMKFKQANYYDAATNMGGGLSDAVSLMEAHSRKSAQPTILLMTDGQTNTSDSGVNQNLPTGWNWNTMFDYDNDGKGDYTTNDKEKRYVLRIAHEAVKKGYLLNTMAVGSDADTDLLKAIAWMGGGVFIHVPGGTSTEEMEAQLLEAFQRVASMVPPARLLGEDEAP